MRRDDAIREVLDAMATVDGAVFTSNGNNSRAGYALGDRPLNFYVMGSMGQCAPLAAGFSSMTGLPTAVLDGDGAVAMGMAGLPLVASTARPPFLHVVLDNGLYETTGGQRVPVPDGLLTAAARGARYNDIITACDERELADALRKTLMGERVAFIQVLIAADSSHQYPRVPFHPQEIADRFMAATTGSTPRTPPSPRASSQS
jgi:thiamine pyrophosphate-dependent acetolactate synthase large subunit-like protein